MTQNSPEGFDARLAQFVVGAQRIIDGYYNAAYPNSTAVLPPSLTTEVGPRYVRVVKNEALNGSRSVYCFIDRTNGNILKAGGWKAPAKNGVRGSIMSENHGLDRVNWHGCIYLK